MGVYNNDNGNIIPLATNIRTQSTTFENFVTQEELVEGLATKQDVVQYSTLPTASADNLGQIVQYIGETGVYVNGYFYKCVSDGEADPTYSWEELALGDFATESELIDGLAKKQSVFIEEYETMPSAIFNNFGKIVQYVGETDGNYTKGSLYKCVATYDNSNPYQWQEYNEIGDFTLQFPNVAAMRNSNIDIPVGSFIHTMQYAYHPNANDKGGATYKVVSNENGTYTDNSMDIIVLRNGNAALLWESKEVYLTAFGVRPYTEDAGEISRNSTRFQHALEYCNAKRCNLIIPAMKFTFSQPISVANMEYVEMRGDGAPELWYTPSTVGTDFITINTLTNAIINNLRFHYLSGNSSDMGCVLNLSNSSSTRCIIKNCLISGGKNGIIINNKIGYLTIEQVRCLGGQASHGGKVADSAGIILNGGEYINVFDSSSEGYANGLLIQGGQFIYVSKCDFPNHTGIWDASTSTLTDGYGILMKTNSSSLTLRDIHITENSLLKDIRGVGIDCRDNNSVKATNIYIIDNDIVTPDVSYHQYGSFITFETNSAQVQNIVARNNVGYYSNSSTPLDVAYPTLTTGGTMDSITIEDNSINYPKIGGYVSSYKSSYTFQYRNRLKENVTTNNISNWLGTYDSNTGDITIKASSAQTCVKLDIPNANISDIQDGSLATELYITAVSPFTISASCTANLPSDATVKVGQTLRLVKNRMPLTSGGIYYSPWIAEISSNNAEPTTPQQFGAKADGVTDDSEAIRKALLASDVVYFPEGVYSISRQVVLKNNQTIYGDGSDKTIFNFTSNAVTTGQDYQRGRVVTGHSSYRLTDDSGNVIEPVSNITMKGIGLQGSYYTSTNEKVLLLLTHCSNSYFEDVKSVISAEDTSANTNAMEILINCHDITFRDCQFEHHGAKAGLSEIRARYGTDTYNINFYNCTFNKTDGVDEVFGMFGENISGYSVSAVYNVLMEGCKFNSSSVTQFTYVLTTDTSVVSGKTYYAFNDTTQLYDVVTDTSGKNPSAEGWYVRNNYPYFYAISMQCGTTRNINFDNCIFDIKDCQMGVIKSHYVSTSDIGIYSPIIFDNCHFDVSHSNTQCSASYEGNVFYTENTSSIKSYIYIANNCEFYHSEEQSYYILSGTNQLQVTNSSIHGEVGTLAYLNGGEYFDCSIDVKNLKAIRNVAGKLVGCKIYDDGTSTEMLIFRGGLNIQQCNFVLNRPLYIQLTGTTVKDAIITDNSFNNNVTIAAYNLNNCGIEISGNKFHNECQIQTISETVMPYFIVINNWVKNYAGISSSNTYTQRYGNSFDTNVMLISDIQAVAAASSDFADFQARIAAL